MGQIARKDRRLVIFTISVIVDPLDKFTAEEANNMLQEMENLTGLRSLELDDSTWKEESL